MAKAEAPRLKGIVTQRETAAPAEVSIRNYVDLLWVVGAGVLGVSLLCITAAIALANPNTSAALQPPSIIELAIANVNTAAALTVEAFPQHLITPTIFPSNTLALSSLASPTTIVSITPTIVASRTLIPVTSTRRPKQGQSAGPVSSTTPIVLPTQTNSPLPPPTLTSTPSPLPTLTNTPNPTRTPRPSRTPTDVPPPTTEVPPPTTEVPPPTTAVPPPTTDVPPPTTEVPPPTTDVPPPTTEVPPPTVTTP
ncbi:MAG TPA: hypothetical protein VFC02_02585 [Anaerolineales bacterium]|nr:hypothetical protein [Anaerolineales bacterium]